MHINGPGHRGPRLAPLAACLAAALTLTSATAEAARTPRWPTPSGELLDRARNDRAFDARAEWTRPDPVDVALRWQPSPHALPEIPANSIVVQNCNDSGSGSLRDALANANNGDTIDLTQLSCSQITLTTGSILFDQTTITLQGPGHKYLSISGGDAYAPLLHAGGGTLYINDLTVEHGMKYNTQAQTSGAFGGCIYSSGDVFVSDSIIEYCTAKNSSDMYGALGGAIYGKLGVSLSNSDVLDSTVKSDRYAVGGGIYSRGPITITDSVLAGNYAQTDGGALYAHAGLSLKYSTVDGNSVAGACGGIGARGNITITNSTISNNYARFGAGGINLDGIYSTRPMSILNSTISGNRAFYAGGLDVRYYDAVQIANSTIAFNSEDQLQKYGAGLVLTQASADLESTIIAGNTYAGGSEPDDVGGTMATITGSNNLIGYSLVATPDDTILLQSAMLGPLAFNGGTTMTHAILSGSPALDAGNDLANVAYDQRGTGYARELPHTADIGAYERNPDDFIFANGFDP